MLELVLIRVAFFRLFNLFIGFMMDVALSSCENSAIDICSNRKLNCLYVDDVVPLSEGSVKYFSIFWTRVSACLVCVLHP